MQANRKPSSVVDDHLSWTSVTSRLTRPTRKHDGSPYRSLFGLAPDGVYMAFPVTREAVSSYLAFAPLPIENWRYISVALSWESPPLDVIQHPTLWSSDFPHRQPFGSCLARSSGELIYACTAYYTPIYIKKSMLHLL